MLKTNQKKLWKQIPRFSSANPDSNVDSPQNSFRASHHKQNLEETQTHQCPVLYNTSNDSQNDADSSPPSFYHPDLVNQNKQQFSHKTTPYFSGFKIKKMHSENITLNQYQRNSHVPVEPKPESLVSFGENGGYTRNLKLRETIETLQRKMIQLKLCFLQLTQKIQMQNKESANLLGQFGKQTVRIISLLNTKVSDKEEQLKKAQQKFLKEKSLKESYLELLNNQWARNIILEQKIIQLSSAKNKMKASKNYTEVFEPSISEPQNILFSLQIPKIENSQKIPSQKNGHCFRKSSLAVSSQIGEWKKELSQSRKFQVNNNQADKNRQDKRLSQKYRKMSYQAKPESYRTSSDKPTMNGIDREIQLRKMSSRIHQLSSQLRQEINKYKNDSDIK